MVRALRQYGRWLRDNYADLEHKEVWQSFVVLYFNQNSPNCAKKRCKTISQTTVCEMVFVFSRC